MPARKRGGKLRGSTDPTTVVRVAAGTADADAVVAANANLRLMGYAIKEAAGTPAAALAAIVQGATAAAGTDLGAEHDLAANGEAFRWFGPDGLSVPGGLSVDRTTGTTRLVLYVRYA
jgi:hypothetical protein